MLLVWWTAAECMRSTRDTKIGHDAMVLFGKRAWFSEMSINNRPVARRQSVLPHGLTDSGW